MSNTLHPHISGEGDRTSFFKLFVENDFRIVIPMLQREYAQGRENAKDVRTEFLKALYDYLDEGVPGRDLDFIYGNIEKNAFIPLDGQQRLTTLFLLHWYLSRITPDQELKEVFDSALLDESGRHCRFSYRTRTSSGEFCDALMLQSIDFDNLLLESDGSGSKKVSIKKTIEDKNWFHLSWKHDPTVISMLNMIDAIHKVFKNRADFLPKLLDISNPVVTFLFMELDKYHLSDELYIKMNSRGKPLTDFENFKARYSEYIGEVNAKAEIPEYRNRNLNDGTVQKLSLDQYFAERIDNAWTNMIWSYRKDKDSDGMMDYGQMCDLRMANLIMALLSLKYIEFNPQIKGEPDPIFGALINQSGKEKLSFLTLKKGNALQLENTVFLVDALDLLAEGEGKPRNLLADDYQHCLSLSILLEKIIFSPRELNYNDRVLLYAYLSYLLRYGNNDGLNQWMRIVSNLANVENDRIDSPLEVSNAIKSVRNLLDNAQNILEYLAYGKSVDVFPSWQIEEERIKAALILRKNGNEWLNKILEVERHGYFNGQIGFILEFAGIWDYFSNHHNVAWSDEEDADYLAKFGKYSTDAQAVFAESYENRINDADFAFERAVLFKGDYLPCNNYQHFNLLSTNTVKNNVKRDFTWKRLLRFDKDEDATVQRSFVKDVFDDPIFDSSRPNESLKAVFEGKSTGEQWRDYLIKYPSAIEYCEQGFISFFDGIEGCEGVLPMYSSRLSGYHRELYTWGLYEELRSLPRGPFEKGWAYNEQKVNDALPYLFIDGYSIDRRNHFLAIVAETDPDDWSLRRFRIEFIQEGSRKESDSLNKLSVLLREESFKKMEDGRWHYRYIKEDNKVLPFLTQLFDKLSLFKESLKVKK